MNNIITVEIAFRSRLQEENIANKSYGIKAGCPPTGVV